jgi:hypothetical protein
VAHVSSCLSELFIYYQRIIRFLSLRLDCPRGLGPLRALSGTTEFASARALSLVTIAGALLFTVPSDVPGRSPILRFDNLSNHTRMRPCDRSIKPIDSHRHDHFRSRKHAVSAFSTVLKHSAIGRKRIAGTVQSCSMRIRIVSLFMIHPLSPVSAARAASVSSF